MKKKIFLFPCLLFILTLFILTSIKTNAAENLEMYFTQGGSRISSITIAPGGTATVDFYINVEGAKARFAQTAIAGINLRNGDNTTTVKVASDMPAGTYYLVGSYNGYSVMIDIIVTEPPHTCVYGSSNVVSNPTCSAEGVKKYSCTCGNSYTEAIPKIAHTYSSSVIAPTCSSKGYTTYTCSVCSYSYNADETAKLAHTPKALSAVASTCTSTGLTAGSKCSVCNEPIVAQEVTPKLEHTYSSWNTLITPTCLKEGKKQRSCSRCNNIESVTLEKLEHNWNSTYTVDKKATCTTEGTKSIHCKDCKETKDSTIIPKTEHTVVNLPQKPATCNSTGLTAGSKCSVCNEPIVAQQTIAALSHNYGSWKTVSAPTCIKEGKEQRFCSSCNNAETNILAKTNHKEIAGKAQNAHSKCSVCNETLSTEHTFDLTIENDSTADIYKYTCDCGYQYTKVIPISVCEHIDEDMNDLCDLCNENILKETSIYYKDCEDCNGTGCKVFVKNIRPIHTLRKSMLFKSTYTFHVSNYLFFSKCKDISLKSKLQYENSFLYNTCATCNGVGTLELTVEPDSLAIEDKTKKKTNLVN